MRYICLILLLFVISCSSSNYKKLISNNGKEIYLNEIKKNSLILIFSYECGYSIEGIPAFNKLKEKAKSIDPELNLICFLEFPKEKSLKEYPFTKDLIKNEDLSWEIFNNYDSIYQQMWKDEVFPQIIYFKNGQKRKELLAPYEYEIEELLKEL